VLQLGLGGLLGLGLVLAVRLAALPLARVGLSIVAPRGQVVTAGAPRVSLDSLATATIERDPFRLTRRPATSTYDPLRLDEAAAAAPKPVLQLAGIVWEGGRDPTAVVEGFPGVDGPRVVKVGDVVSGLRVQRIARDAVRIDGMDTTWILKVRAPWH
jgi:hypothetical protein